MLALGRTDRPGHPLSVYGADDPGKRGNQDFLRACSALRCRSRSTVSLGELEAVVSENHYQGSLWNSLEVRREPLCYFCSNLVEPLWSWTSGFRQARLGKVELQ